MKRIPRTRLIEERKSQHWSQQEVADFIGTTRHNVSRWEAGLTAPGPYFRTKLCELFGKRAQELELFPERQPQQADMKEREDEGISQLASQKAARLWSVPYPRNPFFTGREDLLRTLHEKLCLEYNMALTQPWAMSGLGGIGKTQIAIEYAYQYAQNYSAIFWVNAATQETLQVSLVNIADLLQLPEKDEHNYNQILHAVKRWFAAHQQWLLILDNADDVTLVHDILPNERSGHILLTTRAQALGLLAQSIGIESMGIVEGTLFLLRRAKLLDLSAFLDCVPQEQLAAAEAIAIEMDFLPLALDQAGAYIDETGCSLQVYLELYRNHRAELLRRRGHVPSDHPESVATTWSLNFHKVEQVNPAAADLLRICAYLSPDAIPEELISVGATVFGPSLQHIATDIFSLNTAIEELRKFSLIQRNTDRKFLQIHRLVQAVLRDEMEVDEQRQWSEQAVRAVNRVFPEAVEVANWLRCQRFLSQAQACSVLIQDYAFTFTDAASLLFRTATYLSDVALYELAESLYQRALNIWEQAVGSEHPELVLPLKRLGHFYHRLGKYKQAELSFQRAIHIQEQTSGLDHHTAATLHSGLGCVFVAQGKYEQAELLLQQALSIWDKGAGSNQLDSIDALNGLAIIFAEQGKHEQAELLFQRAFHIRKQMLGEFHVDVAESLHNLAVLFQDQEKYAESELLHQQAIAIWEQVLRPDHPYLAYPLKGLADLYQSQGRDEKAELLYGRALRIWEQAFGPDHPHVATALNGLARLFHKQGMDQRAESLYQRALVIQEQTLGEHHLDTADTLHHFGLLWESQGRHTEAAALYQRALAIREEILGMEHMKTLETRERLKGALASSIDD